MRRIRVFNIMSMFWLCLKVFMHLLKRFQDISLCIILALEKRNSVRKNNQNTNEFTLCLIGR